MGRTCSRTAPTAPPSPRPRPWPWAAAGSPIQANSCSNSSAHRGRRHCLQLAHTEATKRSLCQPTRPTDCDDQSARTHGHTCSLVAASISVDSFDIEEVVSAWFLAHRTCASSATASYSSAITPCQPACHSGDLAEARQSADDGRLACVSGPRHQHVEALGLRPFIGDNSKH